ncbi:MAG TPA: hypothetical protein VES42_21145 [Pilimelia sp.]|nr:hypothetical protein [Pilimelia sp.]
MTRPEALGAVVHGPVLLGRSPGVAVGLRCVFAHPGGLDLPLVLVAVNVHADAARRQAGPRAAPMGTAAPTSEGWSGLRVWAEAGDRTGEVLPYGGGESASDDRYTQEAGYWIDLLPADGTLRLVVSWPQVGLAEHSTLLRFPNLAEAALATISLA